MKKLIWTIAILWIWIYWFNCFSADTKITEKYDCPIVSMVDWEYNFLPYETYDNILPEEAMTKVFDNLRAACCKQEIPSVSCDGISSDAIFPDSIILFDHLLDVYLRRLDAKQSDNNWWDLLYWLEPDPKWKERREFISSIWNNSDGTPPISIDEFYKKMWSWSIYFEKYSDESVQKNNNSRLDNIRNKSKNYSDRSLVDRYYNACNIVMMMYIDTAYPVIKWWNGELSQNSTLKWFYESCEALVQDRIKSEKSYAEAIMQQQWNVFLDNTVNAYLNAYFLENKLSSLHDKIFNRWSIFKEIVKWVDKLVKNCS